MSMGGRFYRGKIKPPTIQYIEEHFAEFFNFMENISPEFVQYITEMTENYVTYMKEMSTDVAVYLEQTVPIRMNCEGTLTTVAADVDFITPVVGTPGAVGLVSTHALRLRRAFLLIIGRAVNTFAGVNNLDCTVATDNQWQIGIDAGAYVDLQNGLKADGQMLDTDWGCQVQGAIHPFTLMFDITDELDDPDSAIGVRLANARSRQDNLIVTLDVYMKVVLKL